MPVKIPFEFPWKPEFPHDQVAATWQWLVVTGVGFGILAALIIWKGLPLFGILLEERRKAIAAADAQVKETIRQTEEMRSDYQARLQGIEDETARRMEEAVQEAADLRERILAEANQSADAIARRGEEEVARERAKALIHLRTQFVDACIRAAQHAASESIDSAQHRTLVERFTRDLGASQ